MSTAEKVLQANLSTVKLTKRFGGVTAVDAASVEFRHGLVNALIGPNGSGKTTFFNCVTSMIRPDSGTVTYRGHDITGKPANKIAASGIGRSFQICRTFPQMTVLENMLVGRTGSPLTMLRGSRNKAAMERARALLHRVGIDHLEHAEARNISYGQQKLLELAGVLMADPETIMLDEPAGGVNPALIERIMTLITELNDEGKTFLIVEHNMDLVMGLSHHVVVFDRGRPISAGNPQQVQSDPRVLEAYLGI